MDHVTQCILWYGFIALLVKISAAKKITAGLILSWDHEKAHSRDIEPDIELVHLQIPKRLFHCTQIWIQNTENISLQKISKDHLIAILQSICNWITSLWLLSLTRCSGVIAVPDFLARPFHLKAQRTIISASDTIVFNSSEYRLVTQPCYMTIKR